MASCVGGGGSRLVDVGDVRGESEEREKDGGWVSNRANELLGVIPPAYQCMENHPLLAARTYCTHDVDKSTLVARLAMWPHFLG